MAVEEVLQWQNEAIRRYKQKFVSRQGYSAAGRYQIIRSTLLDLIDSQWKLKDLFDAGTQDLLGELLLGRRGFDVWAAGKMSDSKFADSLSQEWASLPFNTGYSYYAGDRHGNKALVSREEMMNTLRKIKDEGK
jgi:muramidase (phage lysozyme)